MPPQISDQATPDISPVYAPKRNRLLIIGLLGITAFAVLGGVIYSFIPRTIAYSYGGSSCISHIAALPQLVNSNSVNYSVTPSGGIDIGGFKVISSQLCATANSAPTENQTNTKYLKAFGVMPVKRIQVKTADYPKVDTSQLSSGIATHKPLNLEMDQPDNTFTYSLLAEETKTSTDCTQSEGPVLSCDLAPLKLKPGKKVTLSVNRTFNQTPVGEVFKEATQTLDPLLVSGGNVINKATFFDNPKALTLDFNKSLQSVGKIFLTTDDKPVTFTYTIQDKQLRIVPEKLARKTNYKLTLEQAISTGDHSLLEPYVSNFSLSGGPEFQWHNLSSYAVSPSKTIILKYSQPLNNTQSIRSVVKLTGNNLPPVSMSVNGERLIINPNADLPRCTKVTITVSSDLQNKYGIAGDSKTSYSFRTLCKRTSVLGKSVEGRNILAHWFGSGPSLVMFVGGIHGIEKSSVRTMESWLDDLERHADRIPTNRTIVVVVVANPDGYERNSRLNARRVDLNRNFPAQDWKPNVSVPGHPNLTGGGGKKALSEPESAILAKFVQQKRPRVVLTFHSAASMVSPNDAGDSAAISRLYASKTPYRYASSHQANETFTYDTTGAFEDWMREIGIPNVLVEHTSLASNEFQKNQVALWAMVGLK
jgi:protein MpaA